MAIIGPDTPVMGDNIDGDTLGMNVLRAKYAKFAATPGFHSWR